MSQELNDAERQAYAQQMAKLGHAIQSGVAMEIQRNLNNAHEPKHLRVGVNQALIETSAMGKLLMKKGFITEKEYFESIISLMEQEVKDYERRLSIALGANITLG